MSTEKAAIELPVMEERFPTPRRRIVTSTGHPADAHIVYAGRSTMEKSRRSVVKAMSWRFVGTIDTFLLSFFISGEFTIAISIGFAELITKTVFYYIHERAWNRIGFGKMVYKDDYQI